MMSFSWKQYEGQVFNNTFPLQRYLGGSSESAVFLTQLAGPQSSKAVLKLIPEGASVDLQLSLWRRASKLTHPNLLQLYQGGRCRLADMDLLYVVMEHAEEKDRKSTRLNSSHLGISYAVFCLKKKTYE